MEFSHLVSKSIELRKELKSIVQEYVSTSNTVWEKQSIGLASLELFTRLLEHLNDESNRNVMFNPFQNFSSIYSDSKIVEQTHLKNEKWANKHIMSEAEARMSNPNFCKHVDSSIFEKYIQILQNTTSIPKSVAMIMIMPYLGLKNGNDLCIYFLES